MQDVKSVKYAGAIGHILRYMGIVLFPLAGVLGLAAIGCQVYAVYQASIAANDKNIFSNLVRSWVTLVVGGLIAIVAGLIAGFIVGVVGAALNNTDITGLGVILFGLAWFIATYIVFLIGFKPYIACYRAIGKFYQVELFDKACDLMDWGVKLIIVFGLGAILLIIADIMIIVAFFSIKET
jgi:uncharacterized membrane protein